MNDDRLNVRVGFAAMVALALAVCAVLALEGRHLRQGMIVHVAMDGIGPAKTGMPVRVSGRDIGVVEGIRLLAGAANSSADARAVLDLWIDARHAWLVRSDSEVFVNQHYVFGEAYIEVGPPRQGGVAGRPLAAGDTLRGIDPPRLDRLLQKWLDNLREVAHAVDLDFPELRQLGAAWRSLAPALGAFEPTPGAFATTWQRMSRMGAEAAAVRARLAAAGTSPEALLGRAARIGRTLAGARAAAASLAAPVAAFRERLEHLPGRPDAAARLARLAEAAAHAKALVVRVERLLASADQLVASVVAGEGTVGAILNDKELADDAKQLLLQMKQRPWETVAHP